jgi:hypothetical protein
MPQFSDTPAKGKRFNDFRDWLDRVRPVLCRAVPVVAIGCLLAWSCIAIRPQFSWDDAEPEILSHAWRLANGKTIYNAIDAPPFNFAIYPPLYYLAVAFLMKLTGLSFLPAKLISFGSALLIAWAMVWISRAHGKGKHAALLAACFLFLIPAFLFNATRTHVQMMAVALSIGSLAFFLRNRKLESLVLSPLFAVLAIYTKQTMLALPLAILTYLALRKRRWLLPYAVIGGMACLIPLWWLQRATHGLFLLDTIRMARLTYHPRMIPLIFMHHAGPLILFIGIAMAASWRRFRAGNWSLIDCYLAWTFIVIVTSLGRPGAHGQYVIELLVVTMVYLVCLTDFPAMGRQAALVSVQILLLFIYTPCFILIEEGWWDMAANRAANKVFSVIQTGTGPILSQQGSFALFGRGEIYIQLFHFSGLSRAGIWDQTPVLKEIEKHTFSWVISEFPIEQEPASESDRERFTPEMLKALRRNYVRHYAIYPYYLYAARRDYGGT